MTPPVAIIGIGLTPQDLPPSYLERIAAAEILIGGRRILEEFRHLPARQMAIGANLEAVVDSIRENRQAAIVVLASGDPLFYGIGAYLVRALGAENVEIFPNVSAVAAAFARIKAPWHEVWVVSLHGRGGDPALGEALRAGGTVAVYTDPQKNPAWIAASLADSGLADRYTLCVLEKMGAPDERISWLTPGEAAARSFAEPNLVILQPLPAAPAPPRPSLSLGMPENAFEHDRGMVTKAEVRAVALSKLRLDAPDLTLWDLGAGSGSVAVEASLFIKTGPIIAVEKDPDRLGRIEANRRRFQVPNLKVAAAVLPDGLDALPAPDRVFIGGGGPALAAIAQKAAERLAPGGVMVINTVLWDNLQAAVAVLTQGGFQTEVVQVQVHRSKPMPFSHRFEAQNPVWIISGRKPA